VVRDERVFLRWRDRIVSYMGPFTTSFTFAWIAAHRGRIRSFWLGGHKLGIIVLWDKGGLAKQEMSELDIAAIKVLMGLLPKAEKS
jgi:hypothetical protein